MADQPTDTERLTVLECLVQVLQGRIAAMEAREAQRKAGTAADSNYLQQQLFGAVEGAQQAESLDHFQ